MKKKWTTRPYRYGDEEGILSLFSSNVKESGFRNRNREWWQSHYKQNPAGDAIIWVAEAGNEIVAHQSWVPKKLKPFSQTIIAGRSGDSRTKADYRRQGIFRELLLKGHETAMKKGWSLFIGLPNENSHLGLIKSGWLDVCMIPKLVKILRPGRVSKAIRKKRE